MLVLMTACHEEFDQPPVYIPIADAVPNMTIAEFKAKHWQESANYVDTVTEDEVIHGWVTALRQQQHFQDDLHQRRHLQSVHLSQSE